MLDERRRITTVQKRFLQECLKSERQLDEIMADFHLSPQRFAKWLSRRGFRWHLEQTFKQLRRQRELNLELGAAHGAKMLARAADGSFAKHKGDQVPTPQRRQAWVDLVKLARDSRARRKAHRQIYRSAHHTPRLPHPDVAAEDAEKLMKRLEQCE